MDALMLLAAFIELSVLTVFASTPRPRQDTSATPAVVDPTQAVTETVRSLKAQARKRRNLGDYAGAIRLILEAYKCAPEGLINLNPPPRREAAPSLEVASCTWLPRAILVRG